MKTQTIRLFDIFVIGPVMVRAGKLLARQHPLTGQAMILFGLSTILYNGYNYLLTPPFIVPASGLPTPKTTTEV